MKFKISRNQWADKTYAHVQLHRPQMKPKQHYEKSRPNAQNYWGVWSENPGKHEAHTELAA